MNLCRAGNKQVTGRRDSQIVGDTGAIKRICPDPVRIAIVEQPDHAQHITLLTGGINGPVRHAGQRCNCILAISFQGGSRDK